MNRIGNSIPFVVVADIGGSHVTCGVYDVLNRKIIKRSIVREYINSKGSRDEILRCFTKVLSQAANLTSIALEALAIAMPGPFDYDNGISFIKGLSKYDSLYEFNLKVYLAKFFNIDEGLIFFRNDAESIIDGEISILNLPTNYNIIGVTLGTGFGTAINKLNNTKDANFGAVPFLNGIADEYFSTRWFTSEYFKLTGINIRGVKELVNYGSSEVVNQIFSQFASNLELFLSPIINNQELKHLIICGNIAKAHQLFLPRLQALMPNINISIGQLGETAAMIGAAEVFNLSISKQVAL